MKSIEEYQGHKFIRAWLAKLCSKGITSMNLEHIPGLWGMMAVTKHLADKTDNLLWSDGARQIYMMFFHPATGERYPKMHRFLARSTLVSNVLVMGKGNTFNFSKYGDKKEFGDWSVLRNVPAGMSELAEELAEVFAQGYNGNSPVK